MGEKLWKESLRNWIEKVTERVGAGAWVLSFHENSLPLQVGKGMVGEISREDHSSLTGDWEDNPELFNELEKKVHSHVLSLLAFPIQIQGKTAGVFEVINKEGGSSFSEAALTFLSP